MGTPRPLSLQCIQFILPCILASDNCSKFLSMLSVRGSFLIYLLLNDKLQDTQSFRHLHGLHLLAILLLHCHDCPKTQRTSGLKLDFTTIYQRDYECGPGHCRLLRSQPDSVCCTLPELPSYLIHVSPWEIPLSTDCLPSVSLANAILTVLTFLLPLVPLNWSLLMTLPIVVMSNLPLGRLRMYPKETLMHCYNLVT